MPCIQSNQPHSTFLHLAGCSIRPAAAALLSAFVLLSGAPSFDIAQVFASPSDGGNAVVSGPVRVVDGDTLAIGKSRIRLYGLDAPESKQACQSADGREYSCGLTSKDALAAKIGKQVHMHAHTHAKHRGFAWHSTHSHLLSTCQCVPASLVCLVNVLAACNCPGRVVLCPYNGPVWAQRLHVQHRWRWRGSQCLACE